MILPWPPDCLFPNKKNGRHWGATNDKKKKYYSDCYYIALSEKPEKINHVLIIFTPPMKKGRPPDLDGALSAIKAGLDGIAKAWGVDDTVFNPITLERKAKSGHGFIEIKII